MSHDTKRTNDDDDVRTIVLYDLTIIYFTCSLICQTKNIAGSGDNNETHPELMNYGMRSKITCQFITLMWITTFRCFK